MKTKDIIEGLVILQKYRDSQDGFETGAEHDMLYAYPTDRPVEQPDLDRLIELRWSQEDTLDNADEDDEDDGEFKASQYNPESSWYCFT